MKRTLLASVIILAFVLTSTATLSAAPRHLTYTPQTSGFDNHWVGMSKDKLVKTMGTPDFTFQNDNGSQTIEYVTLGGTTDAGQIQIVSRFDIDSNGRVATASVSRMM